MKVFANHIRRNKLFHHFLLGNFLFLVLPHLNKCNVPKKHKIQPKMTMNLFKTKQKHCVKHVLDYFLKKMIARQQTNNTKIIRSFFSTVEVHWDMQYTVVSGWLYVIHNPIQRPLWFFSAYLRISQELFLLKFTFYLKVLFIILFFHSVVWFHDICNKFPFPFTFLSLKWQRHSEERLKISFFVLFRVGIC